MIGSENYGTSTQWNTMLPYKKKEFSSFAANWMELEYIILSEISQSMKEKHHMTSVIYV